MNPKIALLCSTGSSVATQTYRISEIAKTDLIITDRDCGAGRLAKEQNVELVKICKSDNSEFSDALLSVLVKHNVTYVISFYTRLLRGNLLNAYANRIFNFHPSLLPACPGQNGFEDTIASGSLFFGSTVHIVDAGMATGQPIIQTIGRRDAHSMLDHQYRHEVFSQQCGAYYQLLLWLRQSKLAFWGNRARIEDANYRSLCVCQPKWNSEAERIYQALLLRGPN